MRPMSRRIHDLRFYSFNGNYFAYQFDNAPLHASANRFSGGNGLFQVNSAPIFPTQNYIAGNFWVDVVSGCRRRPRLRRPRSSGHFGHQRHIPRPAQSTGQRTKRRMARSRSSARARSSPCLTALVSALTTSHAITLSGLIREHAVHIPDRVERLHGKQGHELEPDVYNSGDCYDDEFAVDQCQHSSDAER